MVLGKITDRKTAIQDLYESTLDLHMTAIIKDVSHHDMYSKEEKAAALDSLPAIFMKLCTQIIDSILGEAAARSPGGSTTSKEHPSKFHTMRQALSNIDLPDTVFKFNAACPVRFAAECAVIQGLWKHTLHADALKTPQELLECMAFFAEARSEHWLPESKRENNEAIKWNEVVRDLPTLMHFYNCMVHCGLMEDINRKVERVARIINSVIPNPGTTKYANGSNRSMLVEMRFNMIRKYFDIKKRKGNGQKKRDAKDQRGMYIDLRAEAKEEIEGSRAPGSMASTEKTNKNTLALVKSSTDPYWIQADSLKSAASSSSSSSTSGSSSSSSKPSSYRGKAAQPARRSSVVEFTRRNNAARLAQSTSGGVEALLTFKTGQQVKIQPTVQNAEDTQPYAKTYSASGMSKRRKRSLEGNDLSSGDFPLARARRTYSTTSANSNSPTNSVLGSEFSVRSANIVSRSSSTGSNSDYSASDYDYSSVIFNNGYTPNMHDRSMSLGSPGQEFTEMVTTSSSSSGSGSGRVVRAVSPLDGNSSSSSDTKMRMRAGSLPPDLYLDMASRSGDRSSFYNRNFASPDSAVSSSTATLSLLAAAIDAATGAGAGSTTDAGAGAKAGALAIDVNSYAEPLRKAPSVTPTGVSTEEAPATASALPEVTKGLHSSRPESAFVAVGSAEKCSQLLKSVNEEAELEAEARAAQAARLLRFGL